MIARCCGCCSQYRCLQQHCAFCNPRLVQLQASNLTLTLSSEVKTVTNEQAVSNKEGVYRSLQSSWVLCNTHRWIGDPNWTGRRLTILQHQKHLAALERDSPTTPSLMPYENRVSDTVPCLQAKRFNRKASCAYCHDRIWGLGRQGFKCIQCRLLIHKKCHKLCRVVCDARSVAAMPGRPANSENVTPEQSMLPGPELTNDPVIVEGEDQGGAGSQQKSNMVSLADFDLIKVIGRGSYAKVLMVELKSTKRIYAMKVIKKELVTDDEDIDWVQTEKHVFETASNHPFLVGLHSCFQTASRYLHHHLQFLSSLSQVVLCD